MAERKFKAEIELLWTQSSFEAVSFNFSNSAGTSPCTGSVEVLVDKKTDEKEWPEIFDIRLRDYEAGTIVFFNELRTTEIRRPYLKNALEEKEVWTVSFEDNRWRLQEAKIYGMYNGMKEVFGNKWQWDKETLDKNGKPWTYKLLIDQFLELHGLEYSWTFEKAGTQVSPKFTMRSKVRQGNSKKRANQHPLNKKWDGRSLAEVMAELLREIRHTCSIDFTGRIIISPVDEDYSFQNTDWITENSYRGNKKRTEPDWVLVVGSRVRDQIKIMPNMARYNAAFGSNLASQDGIAKSLEKGFTTSVFDEKMSKLGRKKAAIDEEDLGLEPCCPDITGRIYNIWELAEYWGIDLTEASVVYQHKYGVTDWETFISGGTINQRQGASESDDDFKKRVAREITKAEKASGSFLTPSEKEYLKDRPDISIFYSKLRILMTYLFRLFRIPKTVSVNYLWDEEQVKILTELAPDAPIGKVSVPREYILPIMEYLNEPQFKFEEPYVIKGQIVKKKLGSGEESGGDETGQQDNLTERETSDLLKDGPKTTLPGYDEHPTWVKPEDVLEADKPSEIDKPDIPQEMPMRERVRLRVWTLNHKKVSRGFFGSWTHFTLEPRAEDQLPKIDTERGLFLFDKTPWVTSADTPFSESNPFYSRIAPVGVELAYERKDPRLGILNYYVHIVKENKTKRLREYRWYHYETIDDLVEMLREGQTLNREALNKLCNDWEPESQLPRSAHSDSVEFAAIIPEVPQGTLHSVSWNVSASSVTTNFEINSGFDPAIKDSFIKKLKNELEARKLSVPHRTWNLFQKRRGQFDLLNAHQHVDSGNDSDERRTLYNCAHKGPVVLYDPKEEDDVSFCTATLTNPKLHKHDMSWIGPILCREEETQGIGTLQNWVPLYGHLWWTPNIDKAPCDHKHDVGGFYYPYVYMPPDGYGPPPPLVKNPIPRFENRMPAVVYLADETPDSPDTKIKVQKFPDQEALPEPQHKRERLSGNFRTVPRDANDQTLKCGLLVEYCTIYDVPISDFSAVFNIDWELYTDGNSLSTLLSPGPTTGSGNYVLEFPAGVGFWTFRRQLLCNFGDTDTVQDYDYLVFDFKRVYGFTEDTYRNPVYIVALKLVWDWVGTPIEATSPPIE